MHEMATCSQARPRRARGRAALPAGPGRGDAPGAQVGSPLPPRCPPPPLAPTPGCGVPRGPAAQEAALTYLGEGKGQVAKTYQQNASPGPHRGLVHFRHGGKATLMERGCRPAPAAQEFSTIPQGKGSGVARGSSASRVGRGCPGRRWLDGAAAVCTFPSLRERGCSPFCRSRSLLLALRTRPAGTSAYLLRSDQSETQGVDPERSRNAHHLSGAAAPLARAALGPPPPAAAAAPRRDRGAALSAEGRPPPPCLPSTRPLLGEGKNQKSLLIRSEMFLLPRTVPLPSPAGARSKIIIN